MKFKIFLCSHRIMHQIWCHCSQTTCQKQKTTIRIRQLRVATCEELKSHLTDWKGRMNGICLKQGKRTKRAHSQNYTIGLLLTHDNTFTEGDVLTKPRDSKTRSIKKWQKYLHLHNVGHFCLQMLTYFQAVIPRSQLDYISKISFLHFEPNYFTGVNRLIPLDNVPHAFKNEENDIPHLVTKKFSWKIQLGVSRLVEFSSRSFLGHQVR